MKTADVGGVPMKVGVPTDAVVHTTTDSMCDRKEKGQTPQRTGLEAGELIRNRAAAVRDEDLEGREVLEDVGIQQRDDCHALFVDEVQGVGKALRAAPGRVNVTRDVQFHHLFVQGIPEAIAERRCLDPAALAGVWIEETPDEPLFLDAFLQVGDDRLRADAGGEREPADTSKRVRVELDLLRDDVVGLLDEPLYEPRVLAGHHLVRARRDQLDIGADLFELVEMRAATENGRIERLPDVVVVGEIAAAPVGATMRQYLSLVYIQGIRRRHMPV
jgi:hypothetical protein